MLRPKKITQGNNIDTFARQQDESANKVDFISNNYISDLVVQVHQNNESAEENNCTRTSVGQSETTVGEICECCTEKDEEIRCLKMRLERFSTIDCCAQKDQEIMDLKFECDSLKSQYEKQKAETDNFKIKFLNVSQLFADQSVKMKHMTMVEQRTLSVDDESKFNEVELQRLSFVEMDKRNDYTFVRKAIEFLYKDDLTVLHNRVAKLGKEDVVLENDEVVQVHIKKALSPNKRTAIESQFNQRLLKCAGTISSAELKERSNEAYFNKLVMGGIKNIRSKLHK